MADINKAVSDSLKVIIIDAINKIRNIKKIHNEAICPPLLLLLIQQIMKKNLLTVH